VEERDEAMEAAVEAAAESELRRELVAEPIELEDFGEAAADGDDEDEAIGLEPLPVEEPAGVAEPEPDPVPDPDAEPAAAAVELDAGAGAEPEELFGITPGKSIYLTLLLVRSASNRRDGMDPSGCDWLVSGIEYNCLKEPNEAAERILPSVQSE
jgi:hypothetical protein